MSIPREFQEALMDDIPIGVVVLNEENHVVTINAAARAIFQTQEHEILGYPFLGLPGLLGKFIEIHKDGLTGDSDINGEFFVPDHGTQKTYAVKITRIRDRDGNYHGRLIRLDDISNVRNLEERLAYAQRNLKSIIDDLKDYYFETDLQGVVTNINQAFAAHLGYPDKNEIIGKHFRHFTDRETARSVFQNFVNLYRTKEAVDLFHYKYHTRDGIAHIGEATITPILEGDRVIGGRGLLRDITSRIESEEVLQKTKADVEARAEELAAINRIASICSQSLNLSLILQELCAELVTIFPVRNAGIGLLGERGESIDYLAYHSIDPDKNGSPQKSLLHEKNLLPRDVIEKTKPDLFRVPDLATADGESMMGELQAVFHVPLFTHGEAIGIIEMQFKDPGHILLEKEVRLAEIIASQVGSSIENAKLHSKTEKALDIAERDLEIGRQIQSGFFPETIPNLPGYEIATYFEGARQVAGDFYDVFQVENTKLTALVIGDVCDKGVGAALFMVLIRSLFRSFSSMVNHSSIEEILRNIVFNTNNYIAKIHGNANMFVTVFFAFVDPENGDLYYVNAGHQPPAILDSAGKISCRLQPTGPAVGLYADADFRIEKTKLHEGDFLVAFTDGTTDAEDESATAYSETRFMNYIQVPWTSLFSMVYEIKTELRKFMGGQKQFDDIALIAIRRKLTDKNEIHSICRVIAPGALSELQDFIEAAVAHYSLDPEDANDIGGMSTEVLRPLLEQGFSDGKPGLISLTFEREGDTIRLYIRENGNYEEIRLPESSSIDELNFHQDACWWESNSTYEDHQT